MSRSDPTRCNDLRSRLDTVFRRAVAVWRESLQRVLVGQDALGLESLSALTWSPSDRLERFSAFTRAASQQAFGINHSVSKVASDAYGRGYEIAYSEKQNRNPSPPAPSASSLYCQQIVSEVVGTIEGTLQSMTRVVALGLASREKPSKIFSRVSKILRKITIKRLKTAGHTIITQAYNHGKLDAYEKLGVEFVGVIPEAFHTHGVRDAARPKYTVLTAGDLLVCKFCKALEGERFTLRKARALIPYHPECRCEVVPA